MSGVPDLTGLCLNSLATQGHRFCSAEGKNLGLCPPLSCHCKQGCWIDSTASCVLCSGPLGRRAEGCTQLWAGRGLVSPPRGSSWSGSLWSRLKLTHAPSSLVGWCRWFCFVGDQLCLLDSGWQGWELYSAVGSAVNSLSAQAEREARRTQSGFVLTRGSRRGVTRPSC